MDKDGVCMSVGIYVGFVCSVAFHLRLATSCNVLGTAEPATIT